MMPILFPATATTFATHGLGTLSDAISCTVTEERNGAFEFEMQYPITGVHFGHIAPRCIILAAPNNYDNPQPFRIYRISRPIGGVVTIYARHLSYDLSGCPIAPYTALTAQDAISGLAAHSVMPMLFNFSTNLTKAGTFSFSAPTAARALLGGSEGSLLDVYHGEWRFDGYNVQLLDAIGEDRGVKIVYGVNLTDLTQDEAVDEVYTGIIPYVQGQQDSPTVSGSVLIALPDADYTKILPVDLSDKFEDTPTVEQLDAAGREWLYTHDITTPTVSLSVSFVSLRGSAAYEDAAPLEEVHLGDTVTVQFARLGVNAKAKVVKTTYNCLTERLDKVEIGSLRTSIADTIAGAVKAISTKPSLDTMAAAIISMTAAILGAKGGSVRLLDTDGDGDPDTLYIADGPDPATAQKVWRFNYEGWGASTNGYNGPYVLGATFENGGTIDAININVVNINGQNVRDKTINSAQLNDNSVVNRTIVTNGINNRCISSGSIYTSTCNAEIQGYFADVIETQKLYAGNAVVGYLRANYVKADYFGFVNSGVGHQLKWNGSGNPITGV